MRVGAQLCNLRKASDAFRGGRAPHGVWGVRLHRTVTVGVYQCQQAGMQLALWPLRTLGCVEFKDSLTFVKPAVSDAMKAADPIRLFNVNQYVQSITILPAVSI